MMETQILTSSQQNDASFIQIGTVHACTIAEKSSMNCQFRRKKGASGALNTRENFEILGPQGTFETPWGDDEPLRTPKTCLKFEYKLLPSFSMQF